MIKVIEGEYDEWQPIYRIADDATIADGVQVISCDTRDFALGWQFEQPELIVTLTAITTAGATKVWGA